MFIEEMTDVEIADIYKISRQYINCIRRKYKKKLKEKFLYIIIVDECVNF